MRASGRRRLPDLTVDVSTDDHDLDLLLSDALIDLDHVDSDEPDDVEDITISLCDDGSYELALGGTSAARHADSHGAVGAVVEHLNRRVLETTRDAVLIHAGAVEHRGRGIVVSAPSGSGKTTLTAALLARGAAYLTDETTVIDAQTLRLRPFAKPLSVKATGHPLFDDLGVPLRGDGPWLVAARALGARTGSTCEPELVVLPRRGSADRLEPVSRAQGLIELAQQAFPIGLSSAERFTFLGRVADRARFVRVEWSDPLASADLILEDLDRRR